MNSTSRPTCTGFVPESITSGVPAGQGSGFRYRSRLEMKRMSGFVDLRDSGQTPPDHHKHVSPGDSGSLLVSQRVVPDLYRARAVAR